MQEGAARAVAPAESASITRRELASVALLATAILLAGVYHSESLIGSDADEGVYVYAGRLIAEGRAVYRDFMLAHPPLLMLFVAAVWRVVPGLAAARLAFMAVVALGWFPLYGLARSLSRSHMTALAVVALSACAYLYTAGLGRTVRLEPFQAVLLVSGAWALLAKPDTARWNLLAGALFALATLVKLVAIVPVGLLFLADVAWPVGTRKRQITRWALVSLASLVVLVPAWAILLQTPLFSDWVLGAQSHRPGAVYSYRVQSLVEVCVRFPPLILGFVAAGIHLFSRARGLDESPSGLSGVLSEHTSRLAAKRAIALVCWGTTILTAFAFKSYARYYIASSIPWCFLALAGQAETWLARLRPGYRSRLGLATVVLAGIVGPLGYSELLNRSEGHVMGPKRLLPLLEHRPGFMFTRVPDFALAAGRDLYPWYYVVDSFLPSETGTLGDREFTDAIAHCDSVVLHRDEFSTYPQMREKLRTDFRNDYLDFNWELWRRPLAATTGTAP